MSLYCSDMCQNADLHRKILSDFLNIFWSYRPPVNQRSFQISNISHRVLIGKQLLLYKIIALNHENVFVIQSQEICKLGNKKLYLIKLSMFLFYTITSGTYVLTSEKKFFLTIPERLNGRNKQTMVKKPNQNNF